MRILMRLICFFVGHDPVEQGRFKIGFTTGPWPAVDEWEDVSVCKRCGHAQGSFAGFIMANDEDES